jgi:hypothetical protein
VAAVAAACACAAAAGPAQGRAPAAGPRHAEPARVGPRQAQPARVGPRQTQPARVGPRHAQPARVGPRHAQPARVGPRQTQPAPAAQLQGTFTMSGTVTVAHLVLGEHVGEAVERTWTFTPLCATAPCATVQLVRTRATGTDTLTLTAVGSSTYTGTGRFFAPLRCAGRIYRPGEMIPFRITVHVTATAPGAAGGPPVASAISATYVNTSRVDLTPCLTLLGHDAARYTGQPAAG